MEENIDVTKLKKLYTYMNNPKIDVEFLDKEVTEFNNYVHNNDIISIIHLFDSKNDIELENLKDIIYSKVESLWKFIIDESYKKWADGLSRNSFLNELTNYEKLAVMFGNFNYQVENGGLLQWNNNDYSKDLDSLYKFLEKSDFAKKEKFLLLLDSFMDIKNAIEKLDCYDNWYEEDCQTRLKSLEDYDQDYHSIQTDWKNYFENYLIENIPDEYLNTILNYEKNINI